LGWACFELVGAVRRLREGKLFPAMMTMAGVVYGLGFQVGCCGWPAWQVSPATMISSL